MNNHSSRRVWLLVKGCTAAVLSTVLLTSCGGGSDPAQRPQEQPAVNVTKVTYYPEPASPLAMKYTLSNGVVAKLMGQRDADGQLIRATQISIESGGTGDPSVAELDADGRMSKVAVSGVGILSFKWLPSGKAEVSAVLDTGDVVKVEVDAPKSASASVLQKAQQHHVRALAAGSESAYARLTVTVKSDVPESGAKVWANILTARSLIRETYPLQEVAGGVYDTTFVNTPSVIARDIIEKGCNDLVEAYSTVCEYTEEGMDLMVRGGCVRLGVAASLVAGPEMLLLVPVCQAAFGTFSATCKATEHKTVAGPLICKAIEEVVSFFDPDGVNIKATASKGGRQGSVELDVQGKASAASAEILLPAEFQTFTGTLVATGSAFLNLPDLQPPLTCSGTVSGQYDMEVKVRTIGKVAPVGKVTGHRGQMNTRPCGFNNFLNSSSLWNLNLTGAAPGLSTSRFMTSFDWGTSTTDFKVSTSKDSVTSQYSVQAEVSFRDVHSIGTLLSGSSGPMMLKPAGR